ncbi:cytochrome P450, putative [Talaromyces stipitatus ATCC 10500]|uniref:Cytochrome P450, putative n=1 Tax=Talaromyces stipitatus (strain ATCC 10500 / CBS 375.48 / QM 6759 / NRRL 1006) TaxID=441959 RepID=B8MM15_TALSN|nr:cytochrome P450, putative [Talaromyces stipitatus ATCC 10500]EED13527.1 cytochrome P450, putative [Talaromyces stipitatus ATCC 10500]
MLDSGELDIASLCWLIPSGIAVYWVYIAVFNIFWHPLAAFPGPPIAAISTLYKAYIDLVSKSSFVHTLEKLHAQYGDVVRVGPNEIHFQSPSAYLEIYNVSNRWDKEETLYHSFGEDRSSFGFLTYDEAKERKNALSRLFSQKAIADAQALVLEKVVQLCDSFEELGPRPADLFYAYRCMSVDVITYLCFGNTVNAIEAPGYEAPIIKAMDASLPVFVGFKHSSLLKGAIMNCPPNVSKVVSPATSGLVDLQQILKAQIKDLSKNPERLRNLPHSTTIYHELLRPEAYSSKTVPSADSLYEESQALLFGGADTTGTTLMHGSFYVLTAPTVYRRLKEELISAWPVLEDAPDLCELQKLPYLTAVLKESLRMSPGVASPLPRVVPASGARIGKVFVPGGTIVEMSGHFVHRNEAIFPNPHGFIPDRWLGDEGKDLDKWLVAFSKGPRSCLGINLAWAELYLCFAYVFRKFELEIDPSSPKELKWRDCFLPEYHGPHLKARLTKVAG